MNQKRSKSQKRKRNRTGRQTLNYLLLLLVACAIMFTLSITVLFHVKTITTDGLTKYPPQALITACGVKEGDNLLRISGRSVSKKLMEQFPYIEALSLRRVLPDKLILQVTEAKPLGACETESGYVIVGETGRILEIGATDVPNGVMAVYGMPIFQPKVGRILGTELTAEKVQKQSSEMSKLDEKKQAETQRLERQKKESMAFATLTDLVEAVQETNFENITLVDLSDSLNTAVVYDGRIVIELGSVADLSYKLQFVNYVLEQELPTGFKGVVDASYCTTSKSVVTSTRDVSTELETRRTKASNWLTAEEKAAKISPPKPNASSKSQSSENSDSKEKNSSSSSESSKGPESSTASNIGPYSPEQLAVKPGTGKVSSSQVESSSKETSTSSGE